MTIRPLRVVKVGGSLLDYASLVDALTQWLFQQPPARNLLISGGGAWADEVRRLHRSRRISAESAHWLAIRAMRLTGWMLAQWLPHSEFCAELDPLPNPFPHAAERIPRILDVEHFLRHIEPQLPGHPLPVGWHVTSDSIAARLAAVTGAEELVLLKSTGPPQTVLEQAATAGEVDRYFPVAAAGLPQVRWVNLRDDGFATSSWHPRKADR